MSLPILYFRKLFFSGKISKEDYWLHVKFKLEVIEDIKNSFFNSINYLKVFKDKLLLNYNFFENYDMNLLLDHNDVRSAASTILTNGTYEPVQMNLICQLAKGGSYFVDVGSNVGIFPIAVSLVNPKIRISSFEPNIDVFEQQEKNLALNNVLTTNIFNYGLGNQTSESVDFFIPNFTGSAGGVNQSSPRRRLSKSNPNSY